MDQHKFLGFWSPLVKYIHLPKILVSTLITRPKLILNAEEPLDAIYMQVLVVLFNLLQIITIPLEIVGQYFCSAVQTKPIFENMENQKTY